MHCKDGTYFEGIAICFELVVLVSSQADDVAARLWLWWLGTVERWDERRIPDDLDGASVDFFRVTEIISDIFACSRAKVRVFGSMLGRFLDFGGIVVHG